jgi:hypothetical protein
VHSELLAVYVNSEPGSRVAVRRSGLSDLIDHVTLAAQRKRDVGAARCAACILSRAALAAPRGDGDVLPAVDLVGRRRPWPEKGSVVSQRSALVALSKALNFLSNSWRP